MTDYMAKFRLDKKVVAVCGGLGLLGKQVSIASVQAGAKVLVLDLDDAAGKALEKEYAGKLKYLHFDITDLEGMGKKIAQLFNKEGAISVWVNAAYPRTKDWGDSDLEGIKQDSWSKNVQMHMDSYCLSTRDVAAQMRQGGIKGSIINFGSIYGVVGPDFEVYSGTDMKNEGTYAAIKGGIVAFSRYAASYYGRYGIRVNCICPGGISDKQNPVFVANYERRTPLRRMGNADEIAAATLFLASDAASYITGATIMVDGGWTCI